MTTAEIAASCRHGASVLRAQARALENAAEILTVPEVDTGSLEAAAVDILSRYNGCLNATDLRDRVRADPYRVSMGTERMSRSLAELGEDPASRIQYIPGRGYFVETS